jgi:hypothetical protein
MTDSERSRQENGSLQQTEGYGRSTLGNFLMICQRWVEPDRTSATLDFQKPAFELDPNGRADPEQFYLEPARVA